MILFLMTFVFSSHATVIEVPLEDVRDWPSQDLVRAKFGVVPVNNGDIDAHVIYQFEVPQAPDESTDDFGYRFVRPKHGELVLETLQEETLRRVTYVPEGFAIEDGIVCAVHNPRLDRGEAEKEFIKYFNYVNPLVGLDWLFTKLGIQEERELAWYLRGRFEQTSCEISTWWETYDARGRAGNRSVSNVLKGLIRYEM